MTLPASFHVHWTVPPSSATRSEPIRNFTRNNPPPPASQRPTPCVPKVLSICVLGGVPSPRSMDDVSTEPASASTAVAATATSPLLALTTPFIQSPSCADVFVTTSVISSFYWNDYSTTTIKVLASDPADPRFPSCQPSGWGSVAPQSRFSFSPAVCPGGWTAYELSASETDVSSTSISTVSTAYCCSRFVAGPHYPPCFSPDTDEILILAQLQRLQSSVAHKWTID